MEELFIRREREEDWHQTEWIAKKAFWNLHVPGCDEHYLVHRLRSDPAFLPALSRVAELNGRVVGAIFYAKAFVEGDARRTEVLTFGPLCVEPEYQKRGIGVALLKETLDLARDAGHRAAIIYGEPGYYPRFGFVTCDRFGITTAEGKNFDAFMGIELVPGGLHEAAGRFYEPAVYENLPTDAVDEYDRGFPYMPKLKLPGQWA